MSQKRESNLFHIEGDSSIVTSTIYKLNIPGEYSEKYSYSRYGNPTRDALESSLAHLDGAKFSLAYSSKTAASLAVFSWLKTDDSVIFSDVLGCEKFKALGVRAEYVNCVDLTNLKSCLNPNTKFVWIETTTTLMTVLDIKAIADIVHEKSKALLVVDNSLLTPCFQRPLELGADAVIYSLGDFIGGHSDVSAGAVTTNDQRLYEKLKYHQYSAGAVPSPFDCYIISRSLKTLSIRMERHSENAVAVAEFLVKHPKVEKVFHPSLKSHVNHDIGLSQSGGYSGIVTFQTKGSLEETKSLVESFKTISITGTIGGVESSVSFPWTMSYSHFSEKLRLEVGVTRNLVTLSVGIGDVNALIADLDQALINVTHASGLGCDV